MKNSMLVSFMDNERLSLCQGLPRPNSQAIVAPSVTHPRLLNLYLEVISRGALLVNAVFRDMLPTRVSHRLMY